MNIQPTKDIKTAVKILRSGRIVACPTGTAYALAVDALQGHALQRLRQLKQRPLEKAFTVFAAETIWLKFFIISLTEAKFLAQHRGQALTVLLSAKESLQHVAQEGKVGLRLCDHPIMTDLANAAQVPLTATSANLSNQPSCFTPTCISDVFRQPAADGTTYDLSLGCILDGGQLPKSEASTIVKIQNGKIIVIRDGKVKI